MRLLLLLALSAFAAPSKVRPVPRATPGDLRLTADIARDASLVKLADAGAKEFFEARGLTMWHLMRAQGRAGHSDRVYLTLSTADGSAPRDRIERVIERHRAEISAFVAQTTGVEEDAVMLSARPLDNCCGVGCRSCLRSKQDSAQFWTGGEPHREKRQP